MLEGRAPKRRKTDFESESDKNQAAFQNGGRPRAQTLEDRLVLMVLKCVPNGAEPVLVMNLPFQSKSKISLLNHNLSRSLNL